MIGPGNEESPLSMLSWVDQEGVAILWESLPVNSNSAGTAAQQGRPS